MAYVDAEKLKRNIRVNLMPNVDIDGTVTVESAERYFLDLIDKIPTADVEEVKHGEWSHLGGDEWCCTNCGKVISTEGSWEKPTEKHCDECGAKMDGGKAE